VAIACLLAALNVGSGSMQRSLGIPVSLAAILEAILILLVLAVRMPQARAGGAPG
jgi:ABC-type uncharacterized transport system permease subunit